MERIDGRTSGIGKSFNVQIRCGYGRGTARGKLSDEIEKEMSLYAENTPSTALSS
jgi:hypothetical protein